MRLASSFLRLASSSLRLASSSFFLASSSFFRPLPHSGARPPPSVGQPFLVAARPPPPSGVILPFACIVLLPPDLLLSLACIILLPLSFFLPPTSLFFLPPGFKLPIPCLLLLALDFSLALLSIGLTFLGLRLFTLDLGFLVLGSRLTHLGGGPALRAPASRRSASFKIVVPSPRDDGFFFLSARLFFLAGCLLLLSARLGFPTQSVVLCHCTAHASYTSYALPVIEMATTSSDSSVRSRRPVATAVRPCCCAAGAH
ncbi:hypothetical protein BJV77DRAFT_521071 [Russula vinacea]|nr:hypothetical protein BJV77DRAFT_521071 [Russula vinacea]